MFAERTKWNLDANPLSKALAEHRAAGKPLIDLSASNPTECGFEYDRGAILQALGSPAALHYEPNPRGLETARRAVSGYYAERGSEVSVEDIVLTASTSEAYSFVFRTLCNPGEEVLAPEPSYPLFGFLGDIHDVKMVRYPLIYDRGGEHGWQMDFHALEEAITPRTRGVIVVNPNNPTGHFCKAGEIKQLNEICAARGMAVIADEVFLDFVIAEFTGAREVGNRQPVSFAGNAGALTFAMSGLSKISGLPQMKTAWVIASGPEELKKQAVARLEVIADTYLSVSAPAQLATPAFLEQRHGFQKQILARVRRNLAELDRQLREQKSCGRLEVEGGWYAVLRMPATRSDEEFAIELLATKGVYVHPGHFYDFPGDGYVVASLITCGAEFAEGIRQLLAMIGE